MRKLKDLPLKYQLIIMIFSISLASLWIASTAFIIYDRYAYKENMRHELTVHARIIAAQSATGVAYDDPYQVQQNLTSLGVKAEIVSACVTNEFGEIIAVFSRNHSGLLAHDEESMGGVECLHDQSYIYRFTSTYFDLLQPVMWEGSQKIGELHIRQDLNELNKRFKIFSVVMLLIVVLASIVTIMLSSRIQVFISDPIAELTAVASRITKNRDYSLRVAPDRKDEIGELMAAFNMMLDRIDEQNKALLESKQTLEEQVEFRTTELKNINRELEAFTYSVSHDLRSPLRSIDGFSVALLEDCGSQLDTMGKDYLARIRAASQRMGKLIDSLLYLSRVSRQEITAQAVNLATLADEIVEGLRERFPTQEVYFVRPQTLLTYGDRVLLMAVLENLLGNAWKYSAKLGSSQVELGSVERNGEPVYFVRDQGVGFDMKYADKLFAPFQRLHRSEDFEGLGIGLATVARIVHRHGGEIWAEGLVGAGAVFYFTLGRRY